MHPLMAKAGHRRLTPTYTGLGERAHLAHPAIDLATHITDVLNVIKYEDPRDFVLIGHSYGGMGIKLARFGQRVVFVSEAGRSVDGDSSAHRAATIR